LRIHRGELALDRKGLPALEGMLVARGLMYSSVYFHKTVRIAEQMLARAVERSEAPIADIQKMVDHELLNWLVRQGPLQKEIALSRPPGSSSRRLGRDGRRAGRVGDGGPEGGLVHTLRLNAETTLRNGVCQRGGRSSDNF